MNPSARIGAPRERGRWLFAAALMLCAATATAEEPSARVALQGHVLPALARATPVIRAQSLAVADSSREALTITIVLRRSDQSGFARYLNDLYDSRSPQFRKFLTPGQVSDRFGPSADDYAAVETYFVGQGFSVSQRSSNRLTMELTGTRQVAAKALATQILDYTLPGATDASARRFFANATEPTLPPRIAAHVDSILGLSSLAQAGRSRSLVRSDGVPRVTLRPAEEEIRTAACGLLLASIYLTSALPIDQPNRSLACELCMSTRLAGLTNFLKCGFPHFPSPPPPPDVPPEPPLDPASLSPTLRPLRASAQADLPSPKSALRAAPIVAASSLPNWLSADGTGQKIGLVEFDTFDANDVIAYFELLHLPPLAPGQLSQVHVNGGASAGPSQSEVLLDIDFILPVAPGAQVVVYDAPFTGSGTFQTLFNRMITDGMTIITNSWSYCEDQTTLADVQSIDAILATAAASGISVFNASGDSGSTCLDGALNTIGVPAGSPHATAVGGSSQTPLPGAPYLYGSETWWDGSAGVPPTGKGGFGVSNFFTRPAYQDGHTASPMRSIPDVVANADPVHGIQICQASAGGCPTNSIWGGTSMAAPAWAAFTALLNHAQGANFGFMNPLLYPLSGTTAFHSAASMGSDFSHVGLGSPNGNALYVALAGASLGPVSATESRIVLDKVSISADATEQTYVVVFLVDAAGNTLAGKQVTLTANAGSSAVITPIVGVTTVANGAAVFTVTNAAIEDVTLTAHDVTDGVDIATTATAHFVSPPAVAAGISASPSSVPANGTTAATVTVTLKNAQGLGASGKVVSLSQGSGRSQIGASSPAVTDANGQVTFSVTDLFTESVTYSAIDVTDGNIPVPLTATVSFTSGSPQSCNIGQPVAAAGYAITSFATGFPFGVFGGCAGAAGLAFDTQGNLYVVDEADGNLYKFGAGGGAANASTRITSSPYPIAWCSVGLAFSKDGQHLYMARQFCGLGGDVVEISTTDGSVVRTVGSGIPCATGLAVDPLSGDLFASSPCPPPPGGGTPNIYRIANPESISPAPVVSVYSSPGHAQGLTFTSDGTLWASALNYPVLRRDIVKIAGTNAPTPGAVTTLLSQFSGDPLFVGVTAIPSLNPANPGNPSTSYVTIGNGGIKSLDLTQSPPVVGPVATGGDIQIATIAGPDACLYVGDQDRVYRVTAADGSCRFAPTTPAPALILNPAFVTPNPTQGSQLTLTAQFVNLAVPENTPVYFLINGANTQLQLGHTDASGKATITYTGVFAGNDAFNASSIVGSTNYASGSTQVTWIAGKHSTSLSLNTSASGGIAGASATLTAALVDISVEPAAAIAGATVQFALGSLHCSGVTNASGIASCAVTPPSAGALTMSATYAGSALYLPASAAQSFNVVVVAAAIVAPDPPSIGTATAGDGFAIVRFVPPVNDGGSAITSFTATCTPVGGGAAVTATGFGSPITVNGLINGVSYVCAVTAANVVGPSTSSAASNAVTPTASAAPVARPIPALDHWHALILALGVAVLALRALASRRTRS